MTIMSRSLLAFVLSAVFALPALAQGNDVPAAGANVVLAALAKQDDVSLDQIPSRAIAKPRDFSQLKQGSWSYEVMGMARAAGCQGDGAWIIDKQGSEETYQVFCSQPKQFVAVCMVAGCIEID